MSFPDSRSSHWSVLALLAVLCAGVPLTVRAQPAAEAPAPAAPQPSALASLIQRLQERGVLSKQDASELMSQVDADAADARVQAAEAQLAAAKAEAAMARARAAAAQAAVALAQINAPGAATAPVPPPAPAVSLAAPAPMPVAPAPTNLSAPVPVTTVAAAPISAAPPAEAVTPAAPAAPVPSAVSEPTEASVLVPSSSAGAPLPPVNPADAVGSPVPTTVVPAQGGAVPPAASPPVAQAQESVPPAPAPAAMPARSAVAGEAPSTGDDTVRVTYVPDVVKAQLREEVKDEVLAEARQEHWMGSQPFPQWVSRFTLFGDLRLRYEGIYNRPGNDNTGAFPNFNAINTGAPYDVSQSNVDYPPEYNVDQNRDRFRLRARMGAAIDLADGFTAGLRLATGSDDNPVTENQSLGAANNGQGGDFSKYAVWLDRAYLKYESGGDPSTAVSVSLGRFDNPFFSTPLIWADGIGFDGAAAVIPAKIHWNGEVTDAVKPFLVVGAFPVFNTDLNFSSNQPAKFSSYDKWLEAAQLGLSWRLGDAFTTKTAAAYYEYHNIQGQLSAPFTPLTSSDQGNTDDSRPSFAQNGNTYMELRDIVPGPQNSQGTTDQWQYFGLATPFRDLAVTERLEYNQFDPFQISLTGEFVENTAFHEKAIAAVAVNNFGTAPAGGAAPFLGGNKGWLANLTFGDAVLQKGGNWNFSVGYRSVESDAVVDGFDDADFGGILTGTNLKGTTLGANLALTPAVSIGAHWFSSTAIAGPVYRNDDLQIDINGKF